MTALRELSVTRLIEAPRALVWQAWTERTADWWAPAPWTTEIVAQELRPGGRCAMIMRPPDGEAIPMEGVVLEAVPGDRIVFTDAFAAGWVPAGPFMVAIFTFADEATAAGIATRYTAAARHWTNEAVEQHRQMGFEQGWAVVADQLAAIVTEMAAA